MIRFVPISTATTEGSLRTTPSPRTQARVLAVPRSTPMSLVGTSRLELNQLEIGGNFFYSELRAPVLGHDLRKRIGFKVI